jgi:hypothetical protein
MNVRTILLWGIIFILVLLAGCTNASGPDQTVVTPIATTINGVVIRNDNLTPIANALVFDIAGLARDTSASDGKFSMVYQLLAQTKTTIIGSRSGFGNDTAFVTLNPGVDTTVTLRLKADSSSPSGPISSGKAANIVLIASSGENISIRGTGSNETALLTFEVRDSLGIPIGGSNKLKVNFSILGGPGGNEYVFPASAETDALTGRVSTRVNSGTKAGVLQVFATATVPGTTPVTIKSSPVRITISGGLPVADHFSISRKPINIAGGVYDNLRAQIMVIVGDKEGNPVQAGTAVSFTTTGGIIQPNSVTDKDGIATVDLISGNPRPTNSVAVVTATTIGDSGTVIRKPVSILFSGQTRILTPATTVIIPDSGNASFEYRVQDPNGFPLVGGTSISVTVDGPGAGQLKLFGDINKTLEDSGDPNSTIFKVTVQDNLMKGPAGNVTFKISVTSQNGNSSATFPGFVLADTSVAPPVTTPFTSGYASSLALMNAPSSQVSVRGTGANEATKIIFIARDSVGNPVELRKRAYVRFAISPASPSGGEFLFPSADSTDAYGQVTTTFNSGTIARVLQVVATTTANGRTITSSPIRITVAGGLPDQAHFTAKLTPENFPGWSDAPTGVTGTVDLLLGDKFGNPVQPGTAIYFTTSGGVIQSSAVTDASGHASATLSGGRPFPSDNGIAGSGHVTVTTVGENGQYVTATLPFLYTVPIDGSTPSGLLPRVTVTPSDTVKVLDGSYADVSYSVADVNGNPLTGGSAITVAVSGPAAGSVALSGDLSVVTNDTRDRTSQVYKFRVADSNPNGGISGDLVFTVFVNGVKAKVFTGYLYSGQVTTIVPPSAREPSQIAFLGITNPDIFVAGVGNTENTVITYEVRDSLGLAIDRNRRAYATFSMSFYPNTYVGGGTPPTVIPGADSTDDTGKLRASIVSGTEAGVIQLIARITLPSGKVIVSQPVKVSVHAGFPDQNHFTLIPSRYVFPGLDGFNQVGFSVVVGDRFSNPVQAGTAVYFHTQAGVITTGSSSGSGSFASYTDAKGIASSILMTVNPKPTAFPWYDPSYGRPGYHWLSAQTQGNAGVFVVDSVLVVWNKAPIIVTGIPAAVVSIPRGSTSNPIGITVTDANGNPLCDGTTISASITFTSDVVGIKFGVSGGLSDVVQFVMPIASYARFPGPGVTAFTFNVSDLSTNGGAVVGQTVIVQITVTSPGLATSVSSFTCVVN